MYSPSPAVADVTSSTERRRRHTWNTSELQALSWSSLVMRDAAAWALTAMGVTGLLAVLVDVSMLLAHDASPGTALAAGLFAAGLAAGLTAPLTLLLAGLAAGVRWIWLHFGRRWAAFAPVVLVGAPVGWLLAVPPDSKQLAERLALVLAFVGALSAVVAAGRSRHRGVRIGGSMVLGLAALAIDLVVPKSYYREIHDLACLVALLAVLVAARPLQRRAAEVPPVRLLMGLLAGLALAAALMTTVDQLAPGWRRASAANSRYAGRLLSLTRTLVDLDGDGFSPIGWGGDCDDFDRHRSPLARDSPGEGDRNCNGVDPPRHPTDRQRGLAPPQGDPDLATGAADLVLLITIDCLRADLFRAAMPRLAEHAARGLTFDRMYAAGTRTSTAMPLIATGGGDAVPLGRRLAAAGVSSTLILGVNYPTLIDGVGLGMTTILPADGQRWTNAVDVTGRALADLRKVSAIPGQRHFAWIHYFDAHAPSAEALPPRTADGARAAREYYLAGLRQVDREVGDMLDMLVRRKALDRAVVIITADHGESFGEHGLYFHNVSGYEPVAHVPAVLLAPGIAPGSYPGLVSHRDLYATVLGAFGLVKTDASIEHFGRSWLRLRQAPREPLHQFVAIRTHRFTSGPVAFSPMLALVAGHHKLVKALDESELYELYDLDADPGEAIDLAWTHPELREPLERDLDLFRDLDRWP